VSDQGQEHDPSPVGEYHVQEGEDLGQGPPDNARADDISHNHEQLDEEPNV
jgi:hypothetical protein